VATTGGAKHTVGASLELLEVSQTVEVGGIEPEDNRADNAVLLQNGPTTCWPPKADCGMSAMGGKPPLSDRNNLRHFDRRKRIQDGERRRLRRAREVVRWRTSLAA
jgi:hypothetical protein